jgi:hypothetical protein
VTYAFPAHIPVCQPAQFFINEWHQLIARTRISLAPGDKQLGNFMW